MPKIKKIPTEDELYNKLSYRCSVCEYAPADIIQKIRQTGASSDVAQRITDRLIDENFISEERYTHAFVHDKFQLSRWGRIKIAAALRAKRIPARLIDQELNSIDEELYTATLRELLNAKSHRLNEETPLLRTRKLLAFAASRGFEPHLVIKLIEAPLLSDEILSPPRASH